MLIRVGKRAYYFDMYSLLTGRRRKPVLLWLGVGAALVLFLHIQRGPDTDIPINKRYHKEFTQETPVRPGDEQSNNGRKIVLAPKNPMMAPSEEPHALKPHEAHHGDSYWIREPDGSLPMPLKDAKKKSLLGVQKEILKNQIRPDDSRYNINVTLSDHLSMDRSIPDTRPDKCKNVKYDYRKLPNATVVIPFYNEALSVIIRGLHSVLARTPEHLLAEIILVDDFSQYENLGEPLDRYVKHLPKVILVRNKEREGLIRARMRGCHMSTGEVIVFHDAHTEVNTGWLEPILDSLNKHPNAILQPFVDGIDRLTFTYDRPMGIHVGAFRWSLKYVWMKIPDHESDRILEEGRNFPSPTLVGCALAARKDYFLKIGAFDEGLEVWGGENIELAFRAWMCHGMVETVTCSRVGHVFKEFPYRFPGDKDLIVEKNLMRVADVWMGGLKKYFYASTRVFPRTRVDYTQKDIESVKKRMKLRDSMKCKNFEWYLHNVIPYLSLPHSDAYYYAEIMNSETNACFENKGDYVVGLTYVCYEHKIIPNNYFGLTHSGLLRYKDQCVRMRWPSLLLVVDECPEPQDVDKFGRWSIEPMGELHGRLRVHLTSPKGQETEWCITQVTNVIEPHKGDQMPQGMKCDSNNPYQKWGFTYKFDYKA